MKEIEVFKNNEFGEVRAIEINGEPWLVGKDVAEALGYSNPQKAIRTHVDEEDKGVNEMDTPGGKQNLLVINESGLYSLVLSSKLPGAKRFKKWVTSEVLPSIRKHGMYATDELLDNPDLLIQVATKLKEERERNKRLEEENKNKSRIIEVQKPKVEFYDEIIESSTVISMKNVADILNIKGYGRNNLFKFLRNEGILNRRNDPYRKYIEQGLFEIKESKYIVNNEVKVTPTTYVTQKGLDYIRKLFKEKGDL